MKHGLAEYTRHRKVGSKQRLQPSTQERLGFKRAAVAVARKLAVTMHAMLKTGTAFNEVIDAKVTQ